MTTRLNDIELARYLFKLHLHRLVVEENLKNDSYRIKIIQKMLLHNNY